MKRAHGVGLLVLTTLIWGTTFPSIKVATAYLTPGQIVASRFAVALLALAWFLRKATRLTWFHGLLTGLLAAVSFLCLASLPDVPQDLREGALRLKTAWTRTPDDLVAACDWVAANLPCFLVELGGDGPPTAEECQTLLAEISDR